MQILIIQSNEFCQMCTPMNCHPSQGTDHVHHSRKVPLGPVVCAGASSSPDNSGYLVPNCVGSFKMAMVGNQCTVQSRVVFRWDRQLPTHRIAYAPFLSITQPPGRRSPWVYCCLYLIYQLMNKNVKPQIWNIDLSVSPFNCLSFCLLYLNLCY